MFPVPSPPSLHHSLQHPFISTNLPFYLFKFLGIYSLPPSLAYSLSCIFSSYFCLCSLCPHLPLLTTLSFPQTCFFICKFVGIHSFYRHPSPTDCPVFFSYYFLSTISVLFSSSLHPLLPLVPTGLVLRLPVCFLFTILPLTLLTFLYIFFLFFHVSFPFHPPFLLFLVLIYTNLLFCL